MEDRSATDSIAILTESTAAVDWQVENQVEQPADPTVDLAAPTSAAATVTHHESQSHQQPQEELWSSILNSVQSSRGVPTRNLVLLGESLLLPPSQLSPISHWLPMNAQVNHRLANVPSSRPSPRVHDTLHCPFSIRTPLPLSQVTRRLLTPRLLRPRLPMETGRAARRGLLLKWAQRAGQNNDRGSIFSGLDMGTGIFPKTPSPPPLLFPPPAIREAEGRATK